MRSYLLIQFVVATALSATAFSAQTATAQAAATRADIDRLTGPGWTGTLTYRDYTTEARTTIKAAPLVTRLGVSADGAALWDFRMAYADEPHANTGDTLRLSPNGTTLRGASVVERRELADGRVQIVTEQDGRDNERPARIRTVYLLGAHTASLQKLVRYEGKEFFERHIYEWARVPDRAGAERAALDYIEGFYEGDTVKLYRSVSPEVLKFGYSKGRDGSWQHVPFPWASFGNFAAAVRAGRNLPPANAPKRVVLYDVQEQIAAARVDAWWGMDYLLMARMDGRWKITHVLWQGPPPNNRP